MALILENIEQHLSLSPSERELFLSKTERRHYKAKTILLQAGEVCRHSYFVNSGILRSFTINDHIVEHVLSFACSGWWISDMYSLITQKPAILFIQVIEEAEVVILSKENQELLYSEIPKLERFFRILVENSLVAHQQRLMDNMSLSAEQRFEKFCKNNFDLIQKVPQKQIASYLGVTPEFFSKMKARLLKK